MQYFSTIPKIVYNNPITKSPMIMTNILKRVSVVPDALLNPLIYYKYEVQNGDTPETIAFKYYGDVYRYWIVLLANQFLDPQWCFPLSSEQFTKYLTQKYNQTNDPSNTNTYVNIYNTIHEYQKVITSTDSLTGIVTVNRLVINYDAWTALNQNLPSTEVHPFGVGSGAYTVTVKVSTNKVSIYDYEEQKNESKRTISIINKSYVDVVEKQFKTLMV